MNDCPYVDNREDCPHDYCSYDIKEATDDDDYGQLELGFDDDDVEWYD